MMFQSFDNNNENTKTVKQDIRLLEDVPMEVTVELGRTEMKISDILALGKGSVIELGREQSEALDIFVNGKLIGKGEVVIIDDKFGIRLTSVCKPNKYTVT